jgi:diguanylate cyclase (GGDEF)-like protein/PAS domain S-box-containing protein
MKRTGQLTRNATALIVSIDDGIEALLGWHPEQMVGTASTEFIHPDDQASAVAAWMSMIAEPGNCAAWRGRYRTAAGSWKWVETRNTNWLEDPEQQVVTTTMMEASHRETSLEEQLRERKEILSRLSDALPVGLFQIDNRHRMIFTNDRLHDIIGLPAVATAGSQFASLVSHDRRRFARAIRAALAGHDVNDLELTFKAARSSDEATVCSISVRPLTDNHDRVTGCIGCVNDVTEKVALRTDLELRASYDDLTGCLNRGATLDVLRGMLLGEEVEDGLAIAFLDIDGFKEVNDTYGHAVGDELLSQTALRLQGAVRRTDHVGRIGGDEFLVICPHLGTPVRALAMARRLHRAINRPVEVQRASISCAASVGMVWTDQRVDADDLIAEADRAMYDAKTNGRPALREGAPSSPSLALAR